MCDRMIDPSEQPNKHIESCTTDELDENEAQLYNPSSQLSIAHDLTRIKSQSSRRGNDNGLHHPPEPSPPSNPGMISTQNGHASPSIAPKSKPKRDQWDTQAIPSQDGESQMPSQAGSSIRSARSSESHTGEVEIQHNGNNGIRKLSSAKIYELTSSPEFLPISGSMSDPEGFPTYAMTRNSEPPFHDGRQGHVIEEDQARRPQGRCDPDNSEKLDMSAMSNGDESETLDSTGRNGHTRQSRPHLFLRTFSTPQLLRRTSQRTPNHTPIKNVLPTPTPLRVDETGCSSQHNMEASIPSPMPSAVPVPPNSLSTYLELELSSKPPTSLYIHHSKANDYPYESSRVKLERLQNFLLLPPQLEQVLWFGALACLDAWLYSFTLLPLRFLKALSILVHSWNCNLAREVKFVGTFVYTGSARMWRRRRKNSITSHTATSLSAKAELPQKHVKNIKSPSFNFENGSSLHGQPSPSQKRRSSNTYRHHRRTRSTPSTLRENHKADILKGLLILISCTILMHFDASRMYHGIRGQAAIKLYVIYNVLEVCDRLFSAIGQDVLECLFSRETLERKPDGRSKILKPLGLFVLALLYNIVHATALFYQVITLNVAVNSYSNALLTLLMSNQFVEIKSTVFKKFEKENLFQLTCADVVERFQLWLMLTIIAARNIIETGGLSLNGNADSVSAAPLQSASILPQSFTLFPAWTGQIMGPFLLVLGSEMLVDWVKHAYISKFNLIKPAVYGRFLDVLAKDYYTNAFADQNLTRRLGLPVIPLSCLFIRASVQTYHMFLATHMPLPIPSTATSISVDEAATSPATTAALRHIDHIFRRALGRSTFGGGGGSPTHATSPSWLNTDDLIAFTTMLLFFLVLFLVLLALKLVLGMCLLSFARKRYISMKERERDNDLDAEGKRIGGWGVVEVDDAKRSWIYADDQEGLEKLRQREKRKGKDDESFSGVSRYSMAAKRIW